jgi:hypothetical protein
MITFTIETLCYKNYYKQSCVRGQAVERLVDVLRFKPEGGGLKLFIDSASNRNGKR